LNVTQLKGNSMNANNAANGGGFYNDGGTVSLTGIHLNANVAKYKGGGFYNTRCGRVVFGSKTSLVSNKSGPFSGAANATGSGFYNEGYRFSTISSGVGVFGALTKLQSNKPAPPQDVNKNLSC
jgi:hypothetical protein